MKYIDGQEWDRKISKIGLGTARMGTRYSHELSFEMLDAFYEYGGNCLDTARTYSEWEKDGRGKSEECLGLWMETRGNRKDICIVTKGGTYGRGCCHVDLSRDNLLKEIRESMDALRTNYIDIYLLHRDDQQMEAGEIIENLQAVREMGNITYLGVSNWTADRVIEANRYAVSHRLQPLHVLETWWSLAEYTDAMWNDPTTTHMDKEMLNYIERNNMLALAMTSQCRGFFQKAITNGMDSIDDFLKHRIVTPRNLKKLDYIRRYCNENSVSPSAFVSGYITSQKVNGVALVSCSSVEQLVEIMENSDYHLPKNIIEEIDRI